MPPILQTLGVALLTAVAGRYVALWIALITTRESRPQLRTTAIFFITIGGTLGASLLFWTRIPWWYIPLFYCGFAALLAIPTLIFKAR